MRYWTEWESGKRTGRSDLQSDVELRGHAWPAIAGRADVGLLEDLVGKEVF